MFILTRRRRITPFLKRGLDCAQSTRKSATAEWGFFSNIPLSCPNVLTTLFFYDKIELHFEIS